MYAKRSTEFPTLGFWPGSFAAVATRDKSTFRGPFQALSGINAKCTGESATMGALGLFDSGADLSGWGWAEWGTVGLAGYLLLTSFLTTKRGVSRVRRGLAARRSRARRVESLKRQLRSA